MVHTDGGWHEVGVRTVRSVRGDVTLKSSIARFADMERFGSDLHFPDAVNILDWYHLAENISSALGGTAEQERIGAPRSAGRVRCALQEGSFDTLWYRPGESMTAWHKHRLRAHQKRAA